MSGHLVRAILAGAAHGCWNALDVGSGPGIYRPPVREWITVDAGPAIPPSDGHHRSPLLVALPTFKDRSFDLVFALDVIEHLEKPDGGRMLSEMERVARRRVLIFTPNGFYPQESDDPWQVHRSGWTHADFRPRGYTVGLVDFDYGKHGLEPLRGLWALKEISA